MSDASKRGRNARRKGATFERTVAEMWRDEFGGNAKRRLDGVRGHCEDIQGTDPFSLECKSYARIGKVYEWLDQAHANAPIGRLPLVIAKADGRKPCVIMSWSTAALLIRGELIGREPLPARDPQLYAAPHGTDGPAGVAGTDDSARGRGYVSQDGAEQRSAAGGQRAGIREPAAG